MVGGLGVDEGDIGDALVELAAELAARRRLDEARARYCSGWRETGEEAAGIGNSSAAGDGGAVSVT